MRYAYYPGCCVESSSIDYEISIQEVCSSLEVELCEIEDWNCCGATHLSYLTEEIAVALSVRNLARAEKELITGCSICYSNLKLAHKSFCENPKISKKVNGVLKKKYDGDVKIRHLVEVFIDDIGLEELKKRVKASLSNLRVIPYYGCLLTRPIADFDDAENPKCLDDIILAVGGNPLPFFYKTKCCGGPIFVAREEAALEATRDILLFAKEADASCICVLCPLCHVILDAKQPDVEKVYGIKLNVPIIYFTQLVGLALGLNPDRLGLFKHIVSVKNVLEMID